MGQKKTSNSSGSYWIAAIFIAVGLLLLGKNLGIVNDTIFRIVVSWQMLLIAIGFSLFTQKQYVGSLVLMATGVYFLLPKIGVFTNVFSVFFWPAVFILVGLLFIVTRTKPHVNCKMGYNKTNSAYNMNEGYFNVDNTFGSVRQSVVEENLKGGVVRNSFGGVVLDLRAASLSEGKTYIDIYSNFGGVEIYLPSHWNVKSEIHAVLGGYEDSRPAGLSVTHNGQVLILRGNVSFGGVEVKS